MKRRQMERTGGFGAAVAKRNLLLNARCDRAVVCVMKALYWIAKEDIALRKWHSLKDLLVQVGVDLSSLHIAKNATYTSDLVLTQMLQALASVIHDETTDLLNQSTFVGLSADETIDVSNITQLDLHLRLMVEGRMVSRFGAIEAVPNTTAETLSNGISQWYIKRGINMRRLRMGQQILLADILVWLLD